MLGDNAWRIEGSLKRSKGLRPGASNYSALSQSPVQIHNQVSVRSVAKRAFGNPFRLCAVTCPVQGISESASEPAMPERPCRDSTYCLSEQLGGDSRCLAN